jgi:transposase, IS30 family
VVGARSGRPRLPAELEFRFWDAIREGLLVEVAADAVGVSRTKGRWWFRHRGGVMPPVMAGRRTRSLGFAEREELALLRAEGRGVREIARLLGRDPGTVSRELRRVPHNPNDPHRRVYRASTAQADADAKARRATDAKLATNLSLRREVQARLKENHSPEQIAGRLREDFPDDPEMWVSHETIYQALYVQGRGALKRELSRHLRTGRTVRKPGRQSDERRGRIPGVINIADRPKEVEDRAVPGDWESQCCCQAA